VAATIDSTILELLTESATIQSRDGILRYLHDSGFTADDLNEHLDALVDDDKIKRVEDGVGSRGEPLVWYAV